MEHNHNNLSSFCFSMTSRTLFRRLLNINRQLQIQRSAFTRPLVSAATTQQKLVTPLQRNVTQLQSYSQLRGLCSKAGDGMVINIQDEKDFEKNVLKNPLPVVVDFHATWCGPCKLLGPRLESLVGSKKGQLVLAKIDVDENEELAMKYLINSVPTVIGFKMGEAKDKFIGLQDDDIIETFLDRLIG